MEVLPNYLYGPYVIEIHRFLTQKFKSRIVIDNTAAAKSLQVVYGQPRAAFRFLQETFNGKIILPMLNFWISDQTRDLSRERVNVRIYSYENYDPRDNTIGVSRNPAHFDVSFTCNLWCNNLRERDFIIHEMIQAFPMGELSLIYYIDKDVVGVDETVIRRRKEYLLMPLKWDGTFRDETGIENFEMTETRDAIKTAFDIKAHTIIPQNVYRIPIITKITVDGQMLDFDNVTQEELTVEERYIENFPIGE